MQKPDNSRKMNIEKTSIPGVLIIKNPIFSDERGFFHEVFRRNELNEEIGFDFNPVQWSHSMSLPRVIRAVHTEDWNKLIYPVTGILYSRLLISGRKASPLGK